MRLEDIIARSSGEEKAQYERALEERKKERGKMTASWYAALTPEQKAEQARKISAGRKSKEKRAKPGHKRGEGHHLTKLTEAQVREINSRTESAEVVAKEFGVSASAVYNIWTGETWKHLNLPKIERKDLRVKPDHEKKHKEKVAPRISNEIKEEILANPWEGTHELAQRLGLHYFDVATIRLKHNGVYRKCQ